MHAVTLILTPVEAQELLDYADDGSAHLTSSQSTTIRSAMHKLRQAIEHKQIEHKPSHLAEEWSDEPSPLGF
jgi:hypothetical protein